MKGSHKYITRRETGPRKTDKSPQRNELGCKQTGRVTERRTAFECERKRPCTPQTSRQEQGVQPAHKQRRRGDDCDQTRGHQEHVFPHAFPYLRKTHCCNQWDPKSDNDNLVGVQRGPRASFGFHSKHTKKALHKSLHPATAQKLPTAGNMASPPGQTEMTLL